jgi:acyl-CoA thioesterase FadM
MENYLDKTYELRYFEMNKFGLASPTTILTLLEETAAEHCYNIGYSLYTLEKQNIGWVLVSGAIDMMRYPKYKEKNNHKNMDVKIYFGEGLPGKYYF